MSNPLKRIRTIAKAKLSDKSNLGNWFQTRLDICSECPFNSKNRETLSVKEQAIVTMNFGKDSCLACTCEIEAKASVRGENCGLVKIGHEPLWKALPEIDATNIGEFYVENLSADKVNMAVKGYITLNYGTIKRKSNTEIEISLRDKKNLTTNMRATSSCGCTVPVPRRIGDTYFVNITYDSNNLGTFEKTVNLNLVRNNLKKTIQVEEGELKEIEEGTVENLKKDFENRNYFSMFEKQIKSILNA